MKTTSRFFSIALMAVLSTVTMYAQTYDWEKAPKQGEKEIDFISDEVQAGDICRFTDGTKYASTGTSVLDRRTTKTKEELYQKLLSKARSYYMNDPKAKSGTIELRNFNSSYVDEPFTYEGKPPYEEIKLRWYKYSATVVIKEDPKPEPSKTKSQEDKGNDNTTLNHLVVHFDVISRPQGADVEWRVISKTPEVKNTNYKYLQTTPYESTETLTINGLTFNNSGLVQIEIKVSKNGYYPQTKKYNVRSIIDEKEVSGIYRLIKEE